MIKTEPQEKGFPSSLCMIKTRSEKRIPPAAGKGSLQKLNYIPSQDDVCSKKPAGPAELDLNLN